MITRRGGDGEDGVLVALGRRRRKRVSMRPPTHEACRAAGRCRRGSTESSGLRRVPRVPRAAGGKAPATAGGQAASLQIEAGADRPAQTRAFHGHAQSRFETAHKASRPSSRHDAESAPGAIRTREIARRSARPARHDDGGRRVPSPEAPKARRTRRAASKRSTRELEKPSRRVRQRTARPVRFEHVRSRGARLGRRGTTTAPEERRRAGLRARIRARL